jgi:hypothetical protein
MKQLHLLFLLFISISCTDKEDLATRFKLDTPDFFSNEEYELYQIILKDLSASQIIIRQQTSTFTPSPDHFEVLFKLSKMANMEPTLFSNYVAINRQPSFLDTKFNLTNKEIQLISNKEYAHFFERENLNTSWNLFKERYPKSGLGYFMLNKIAFNESKTQAIFGLEFYYMVASPQGTMAKSGLLTYFEKKNNFWEKVGSASYPL